ncbi:hypothetical protein Tco_0727606 [Tanacetum coccineum]|uniref:Uncharacterized protein n=1 Tax=Tanacetum coccineum TaxID=301880 RepID=A0ABQ4YL53_9ASTR
MVTVMSSTPRSTITSSEFDMEDAFSTMNIHKYTLASSATSGSTSFNSSEDSRDGMIRPTFSLFYNNPYLKNVQAFFAKESPIPPPDPITSPAILTPSRILPPLLLFNPRYFLFVIDWIIMSKDFDKVKTKLQEARTQILELQKKHMGQRDKISFVRFRISDLEITLEDIQDRHQL